jgi:hypothetical protein
MVRSDDPGARPSDPPRHSTELPDKCWANIVDLQLDKLPRLDPAKLGDEKVPAPDQTENRQTREIFAAKAASDRASDAHAGVDQAEPG